MVAIHVGSCPPDPEADLKNFHRKQAEYEAAWRRTGDPLALYEALLNARAAQQPPPDWLVTAAGDVIMKGRTDRTAERFRDRMRHVRRYRCVSDLRRQHTKECALDLTVAALEAKGEGAARSTIADSYDRVRRDLKKAGPKSEYYFLVARSGPTVVPVSVTRGPGGELVINGVRHPANTPGVTLSPAVTPRVTLSPAVTRGNC
jgi:hypothetical protein